MIIKYARSKLRIIIQRRKSIAMSWNQKAQLIEVRVKGKSFIHEQISTPLIVFKGTRVGI
jgi:hypothetical protein